jgi:endonuclease III
MAPQARRTRGANDDGYASTDRAALAATALEVTRRLVALYGEPAWSAEGPLGVLIGTILSQRTRDAQTGAAYAALKRRFPSWETMRDAPLAEVQKAIANVNWPELKAPRLQQIARQVTAERGALNLDFLCDLPAEDALAWLLKLTGVGPKTAACTLLFACRKPVLPVDVHVHRVSIQPRPDCAKGHRGGRARPPAGAASARRAHRLRLPQQPAAARPARLRRRPSSLRPVRADQPVRVLSGERGGSGEE